MAICGVVNANGIRHSESAPIEAMVRAMTRGAEWVRSHWVDREASLAVTSTVKTASLHSSDRLLVVCDAEIHNQNELRKSAAALPPRATLADLMAALYLRDGSEFLKQLRGVFSVAVWDKQAQKLLLARDRLGVKPLCYAETHDGFVFASYPRGILASRLVAKRADLRAIVDYLNYNVVPAPKTAYEGVFKVRPGEYLIWQRGQTRRARYWDLQYTEAARGSVRQLAAELFFRIEEAVRVTSADLDPKQVGCFLSGGTDSSTLAGLLSRANNNNKEESVRAFSIGFPEKRFNELEYAQLAAKHFGLRHLQQVLSPEQAYEAIPKIVDLFDEPFANASAIPTYACIQLAKSHGISVMLAGDGGDELFGGNERYRVHQVYDLYQRIPQTLRKLIEPALFAAPTQWGVIGKAQRYIRRSNVPNPERYCGWRLLNRFAADQVLGTAMPHVNGDLLSPVRSYYRDAVAHSELNRLLYIDINMTLGDEDIPKVVGAAEAAGVNVRFPYLDSSLADFSGRLPAHLKVRGFEKRYLFKRAVRDFLPPAILSKKKHGFGLPIGVWLKTDPRLRAMARDILFSPRAYQRGYFQRQFIEQLMSRLDADDTPYYGDLLWVFVMLEMWHCAHMEGAAS